MEGSQKELLYIVMQFLKEENYTETLHKLEMETGLYFDINYFEKLALEGKWEEAEKYFLSFTTIYGNIISTKVVFEIRKHKYIEALDKHDMKNAVDILMDELKEFSRFNQYMFNELTLVLTKTNFRELAELASYTTPAEARPRFVAGLKKLVMLHPTIRKKLLFPTMEEGRLKTMIMQSLKWQHYMCGNSNPNFDVGSLFEDHRCPTFSTTNREMHGSTSAQNRE